MDHLNCFKFKDNVKEGKIKRLGDYKESADTSLSRGCSCGGTSVSTPMCVPAVVKLVEVYMIARNSI